MLRRALDTRRLVVLDGNPDPDSYGSAMARAVVDEAEGRGTEVRFHQIGHMDFDPVLARGYKQRQELEPDLQKALDDIFWADAFIIVYPLWWGSAPAKLKGFFDRVFLPGVAFRYVEGKPLPEKLLQGRKARVLLTSDTPGWFYRIAYSSAWSRILRRQILGFVGFSDLTIRMVSPIRGSTDDDRARGHKVARSMLD